MWQHSKRVRFQPLAETAEELVTTGLSGTVIGLDQTNHQVNVMVRRADTWYARSLKPNDAVFGLALKRRPRNLRSAAGMARYVDFRKSSQNVHPDYSRVRIRFDFADAALPKD